MSADNKKPAMAGGLVSKEAKHRKNRRVAVFSGPAIGPGQKVLVLPGRVNTLLIAAQPLKDASD